MKKILVAVTGMSPQIVTETLFALVTTRQWIPDEIHVLTTRPGGERLANALFGDNGHFARFCAAYATPHIAFSPAHIHLIHDAHGKMLDDIRTPAQNSLAADMIVHFIHDLCARDDTELHVSIAGGRKSMGFYIGYALSLFGRRRDRLSHVLVNDPFENQQDFFYPTRDDHWISTPSGEVNARNAQVMLADIPFVRMRDGLPHFPADGAWTYRQAVEQTQRHMGDWHMEIDSERHTLHCAGHAIPLPPQQFALYAAMVSLKTAGHDIRRHVPEDMAALRMQYLRFYPVPADKTLAQMHDLLTRDNHAEMARILQEASSRIYHALCQTLGEQRARQFRIVGTGRNHRRTYSLPANPQQWTWLPTQQIQ